MKTGFIIMLRRMLVALLLPVCGWAQTIEIHQIDVGAGDAALINIRNDGINISHSILIDAGDRNKTATQTVVNYVLAHARNIGGYAFLDYIISSHYDADHIGGLVGSKKTAGCAAGTYYTGVLGANSFIKYYALLDKGDLAPTGTSQLFYKYTELAGTRRVTVGATVAGTLGAVSSIAAQQPVLGAVPQPDALQRLALGGFIDLGNGPGNVPVRLRLILADGRVYNPAKADSVEDVGRLYRANNTNNNNWGLGWVLEYGAYRYYTAGDVAGYNSGDLFDIETHIATALGRIYTQPANSTGHICAQKLSHHGSSHSSSATFLSSIKSSVGIVSAGTRHEHPRQDVLTRLENTNWNIAATNLANNSTAAYLMTELHPRPRNITLTKGYTSGSMGWFTDPTAPPATAEYYDMLYGRLWKLYPQYANYRVPGHVVTKVYAQNSYNGVNAGIANRSIFTVDINSWTGATRTQTFNCHHQ